MDPLVLLTAFTIGLFGGGHCLGMCGGIMGALTMAIKPDRPALRICLILAFNLGRIAGYVFIAVAFFWLVSVPVSYLSLAFMRIAAGLLLVAMGLYLADWWRGLTYLEKAGSIIWRRIQPLSKSLLPVHSPRQALLLGLLWGWLPCGLVYSALVYSATATFASEAALIMFSFALGTLPTVMFGSIFAGGLLAVIRRRKVRMVMGALLIFFGVWTLANSTGLHHDEANNVAVAAQTAFQRPVRPICNHWN